MSEYILTSINNKSNLTKPIKRLMSYIASDIKCNLIYNDNFIKGSYQNEVIDHFDKIVRGKYQNEVTDNFNKTMLTYTNERVQKFNCLINGWDELRIQDKVFMSVTGEKYTVLRINEFYHETSHSERAARIYHANKGIQHIALKSESGSVTNQAVVFGSNRYRIMRNKLSDITADIYKEIRLSYSVEWVKLHPSSPIAVRRLDAWLNFIEFQDKVKCIDFDTVMTINTSKLFFAESPFNGHILLDIYDLVDCHRRDYPLYIWLMSTIINHMKRVTLVNSCD